MPTLFHLHAHVRRHGFKHKQLFAISLMIFFFMMADSLITFMLPLSILDEGFTKTQMGMIIGSSSFFGALFDMFLSRYLRKPHYRRLYLSVLLMTALYVFVLHGASAIVLFIVGMMIWGMYWDLFHFGNYDFVSRTMPKEEHAGAFGVMRVFHSLGNLIAPIVAGLIVGAGVFSHSVPFLLASLFVGAAMVFYVIAGMLKSPYENKQVEPHKTTTSWLEEFSVWMIVGRQLLPLLTLLLLMFIVDSFFWTLGPLIAEGGEFGTLGGLFLTAYALPGLITGWFVGSTVRAYGQRTITIGSFLVGCLIMGMLPLITNPTLTIGVVTLASFFFSFTLPAIDGVFADCIADTKVYEKEIQSLSDFFYNIGWIVGPMLGGFLAQTFGNKESFSILALTGVVVSGVLLVKTPRNYRIRPKRAK